MFRHPCVLFRHISFFLSIKKHWKKTVIIKTIVEKNVIIILRFRVCKILMRGSRDGTVVRVLASHQCVPGLIPRSGVTCGLSLLLVLYSAPRAFLQVLQFSPLLKKPTFPNSSLNWSWNTFLNEFLWNPWCSVAKQIVYLHIYFFFGIYLQKNHLFCFRILVKDELLTWSEEVGRP